MSREIKFKFWCKGTSTNVNFNKTGWWTYPNFLLSKYHSGFDIFESPDFVACQYIGRKDKNGVEIYEGDIVEAIRPEHEADALVDTITVPEERHELEIRCMQNGEWYGHKRGWKNSHFTLLEYPELKVIGNIFES